MENVCFQSQVAERKDSEVVLHEANLASGVAENHRPTMAENRAPKELTDADSSGGDEDQGSAPAASVPTTSCSEFHSARIESMLSSRSEFETAHSKVHWSELSHHERASSSEESGSGSGESGTGSGDQYSVDQFGVDHRQYFEELQKDAIWGRFCNEVAGVVLGRKVGEGAQAVIYEAQVTFANERYCNNRLVGKKYGYVVKVMKSGYALEDLHRQWPQGLAALKDMTIGSMRFALYGALVKDHAVGRNQFGFVMHKHWGDLRRLIDLRMERNNAKGLPFSTAQARAIMVVIASEMGNLHRRNILHRDLKAANVLLSPGKENCDLVSSNDPHFIFPHVADWECSLGVVGTGFWRAPEILQQLKDRTPSSSSMLVFTKQMDVYSFGMTCYEIVTGLLPFQGRPCYETRDAILDGARPKLPHDMDLIIKDIISNCWDPNPSLRPSFEDIADNLGKIQ